MDALYCKDCRHYLQHYTLDEQKVFRVYCGHCTQSRIKHRSPDSKACGQFCPRTPNESTFATKEYLSRKLLNYVLSLELLPEIEDLPR